MLDYVDLDTFKLENEEIQSIKDKYKQASVEQLHKAIKSLHVIMETSEITISFPWKSKDDMSP